MKKLLQRIMLLSMLAVSTHHAQAAWYSSWGEFQNAVAIQWNTFTDWITSFWKKTPAPIQVAGYAAYKERALTPEEQRQQAELNQAIIAFLNKLQPFIYDLQQASIGKIPWSDLVNKNRDLIKDLDSIDQNNIPQSILEAARRLNDQKIINDLATAFAFLRPQLRWDDLATDDKLKDLRMPYETFVNVSNYIKNNTRHRDYKKWLDKNASEMARVKNPEPRPIVLAGAKLQREYLTILRHYKMDHVLNKLKANTSDFANNIKQVYTKLQVPAPSTSWLTDDPNLFRPSQI